MKEDEVKRPPRPQKPSYYPLQIPKQLQEIGRFCIWKYEWTNSRWAKTPYNPETRKRARTTDPSTFSAYDMAYKIYTSDSDYDGIGVLISGNLAGIDIDNCIDPETGKPNDFCNEIINIMNCYTEKSPSGRGIRMLFSVTDKIYDQIPKENYDNLYYEKNQDLHIEAYIPKISGARYLTITGGVLFSRRKIYDRDKEVLEVLNKYMKKPEQSEPEPPLPQKEKKKKTNTTPPVSIMLMSDQEILYQISKSKGYNKFLNLWTGNWNGYPSVSEADQALCTILAFWCAGDYDQIQRMFSQSQLAQVSTTHKKWGRESYMRDTINKAIDNCNGVFYDPANYRAQKMQERHDRIVKKKPEITNADQPEVTSEDKPDQEEEDYIRFNQHGEPYIVIPLLADYVRSHLKYILVRDKGTHALMKFVYQDGVYRLCSDDMFIGYIKKFIEARDKELVRINKLKEVVQLINTDIDCYIPQDQLNADETIINFQNGLLKVTEKEWKLLPHTPEVYSTIQIPCNWTDKPQDTPVFNNYVKTLADNDPEAIQLLLEFMGVCLSNVKGGRMKKSLFLVGPGDTGKSQLKSLVEKLLGKGNYISIDLKEIEARFGTGAIYGTRLAGSSDMSFMTVDELKTFKKITGGDSLFAEFKGQQAFEFTYNGLLWFCMNRLPRFGGDDGKQVYDRIMVVNCPNVIPKDQQDKFLLDKMYAEKEGIVYQAVKALQTVIANGYRFSEPETVEAARQEYMLENSTILSFLDECTRPLTVDDKLNQQPTTGRVYKIYSQWCRDNNNGYSKTAKEFRKGAEIYFNRPYNEMTAHVKGNSYYNNFTLTNETLDLYDMKN